MEEPGKRWEPSTPAMGAGLTRHGWIPKELLITVIAHRF